MTRGIFGMPTIHLLVTLFPLRFIKKKSICFCMGQPVYGTTFLLHLQKRSLIAEVEFFTAIQKAPAASYLSFPRAD